MDADNTDVSLKLTLEFDPDQILRIAAALSDFDIKCVLDIPGNLGVEELDTLYSVAQSEGWTVESTA